MATADPWPDDVATEPARKARVDRQLREQMEAQWERPGVADGARTVWWYFVGGTARGKLLRGSRDSELYYSGEPGISRGWATPL